MYLLYIVLFLVSLLILAIVGRGRRKDLRLPPGPRGLPVVGYLPWLDPKKPHESLTRLTEKYGRICGLWMGSVYTVLLSDPRIVKQALAKATIAGRAPLYLTHGIMQGYGLICSEGERWKEQRRFVTTCLKNFGMVKYGDRRDKMEITILEFVDEAVAKLKVRAISAIDPSMISAFDPSEILHHCFGNLMNKLVFGKTYDENDETWKWLRNAQEEGVKHIGVAGPLNFLPFLRYLPNFQKIMKNIKVDQSKTHQIYARIIDDHRARKSVKEDENEESFLASFDDEMMNRKLSGDVGSFTEPQYHHLLADLFGAGVDTTFATFRWFLLFMAVHPEEQEKVYREMLHVLVDREPNLEDRARLVRLEASILESQRLRSIVPVGIPHGTTEDTTIGDYDLPKGTMVVPLQWAIHMDPEYWDDPHNYKPERFINEDGTLEKPEAFLPFQSGKRTCPGDELAKMMLFLFAGRILWSFEISTSSSEIIDLDGDCGITLVPKPYSLTFIARRE